MARRVILQDDLDGTVDSEETPVMTWQFSYGPRNNQESYIVDLTEANYERLTGALDEFVKVAAKVEGGRQPRQETGERRTRSANRSAEDRETEQAEKAAKAGQREEIVAWGEANPGDFKVNNSGRGRLDTKLIKAFYDAHPDVKQLHKV